MRDGKQQNECNHRMHYDNSIEWLVKRDASPWMNSGLFRFVFQCRLLASCFPHFLIS